jgi:hypothetical protein
MSSARRLLAGRRWNRHSALSGQPPCAMNVHDTRYLGGGIPIFQPCDQGFWSGRGDSNPRPQRPERCALTKLRYFPVRGMVVHEAAGAPLSPTRSDTHFRVHFS